jgi:hypothetical protein
MARKSKRGFLTDEEMERVLQGMREMTPEDWARWIAWRPEGVPEDWPSLMELPVEEGAPGKNGAGVPKPKPA